jgi:PPK2 family polyphosphate:nucleotide phosphotransferase
MAKQKSAKQTPARQKPGKRDRPSLAERFRVHRPERFRLAAVDPADTAGLSSKGARKRLKEGIEWLDDLQERLYAQDRWAVLLIFQAMDAAGKDSTIEHVMSGINPQGCQVFSFKAPSAEELDHDFLWRTTCRLPERGRIGIFNRSYYEEVLVVRVRPELLARQKLPPRLVSERIWEERCEDIRDFERFLTRNGTVIRKFFLHLSPEEQRRRFLARIDEPAKNWKFSLEDVEERQRWGAYMSAYEEAIRRTGTDHAPWYVVPADHKWFTRLVVAEVIVEALEALDLHFPRLSEDQRRELAEARERLEAEGRGTAAAG